MFQVYLLTPNTPKTMARAMFEYTKTVLQKVSFSRDLFFKELQKALETLLPYEVDELLIWVSSFTASKPELRPCKIHAKDKK